MKKIIIDESYEGLIKIGAYYKYKGFTLNNCEEEYIYILDGFKDYVFDLLDIKG